MGSGRGRGIWPHDLMGNGGIVGWIGGRRQVPGRSRCRRIRVGGLQSGGDLNGGVPCLSRSTVTDGTLGGSVGHGGGVVEVRDGRRRWGDGRPERVGDSMGRGDVRCWVDELRHSVAGKMQMTQMNSMQL